MQTSATTPPLAVQGFTASFDGQPAIKGLNLEILPHERLAIIGPARSGKTTFLRSLNRLNDLSPGFTHSGKILRDGKDIYDADVDVGELRRKLGMVYATPVPLPWSIYDNLAYGLRLAGIRDRAKLDERMQAALGYAFLWDEVKDRLHESALGLSGGQQQRLVIARTIAVEPEVLLLDEPCSALDPISTLKVEELIYELKSKFTIVIVTHNMQQAARVSDYTAFMYMGKLVEFGDTDTLFTNPAKKQTEDYITGRYG